MNVFKQEYSKEDYKGIRCLWTYSSGESSKCCEEVEEDEENMMWNASLSSMPESEKEQDEVKNTPVEEETHNNIKRRLVSYDRVNSAVYSALERARRRHSLNRERESREFRRSLVRTSMLSMSERYLNLDLPDGFNFGEESKE